MEKNSQSRKNSIEALENGLNVSIPGFDPDDFVEVVKKNADPFQAALEQQEQDEYYCKMNASVLLAWFRAKNPGAQILECLDTEMLRGGSACVTVEIYLKSGDIRPTVKTFGTYGISAATSFETAVSMARWQARRNALSWLGYQVPLGAQTNADQYAASAVHCGQTEVPFITAPVGPSEPSFPATTSGISCAPVWGSGFGNKEEKEASGQDTTTAESAQEARTEVPAGEISATGARQGPPAAAGTDMPEYRETDPVEEIMRRMTLEEALNVKATRSSRTFGEVDRETVEYVIRRYKGHNNIVLAAARIVLTQKFGVSA